jgi:ribosomal 50S subunit-associated protein YjgA (DUF615 family)
VFARIPKSFGIRTMLLVVAGIAAAAFIARDYVCVRNAREHFAMMYYLWDVKSVTVDELIIASERLVSAEAESPWISRKAAIKRHLELLDWLLRYFDSGTIESEPDTVEQWRRQVNESIRKYS